MTSSTRRGREQRAYRVAISRMGAARQWLLSRATLPRFPGRSFPAPKSNTVIYLIARHDSDCVTDRLLLLLLLPQYGR